MNQIAVIGSGLLGCLTAYKIAKKFPKKKISLIDNENQILPSFKSIKINNIKFNNGFHALDIERSSNLYKFLKNSLNIKFKIIPTSRYLIINNKIIKENQKRVDYPSNLKNYFTKKKIITNNIDLLYKNLSKDFQLLISNVSKRYSNNLKDNLKYFLPWFLPNEYFLKSKDEGDKFRNKIRMSSKETFLAIPKNGLFENLSFYFKKGFAQLKNLHLKTGIKVSFQNNKILFKKNEKELNFKFDRIFFCTSSMIFIPKVSKIYKNILINKRYFVSCLVSTKSKAKINFSEILFLNKKFIEISRISNIKNYKGNKFYLIEFTFKKTNRLKNQLNIKRVKNALKPIFYDNCKSLKIIDYKITRLVFYPEKKYIDKATKLVKKFIKKVSNNNIKVHCNISFGPINMAKAWISSEKNVKLVK